MLVLTPSPHSTECISGYLQRLSAANGYATPTMLVGHIHTSWHNAKFQHVTPADLVEIAGLTTEQAERVCFVPKAGVNRSIVSLLGAELHVSEIRLKGMRICPVCVAETGCHEAAWHLKLMNWCPRHRIPLLERCEECKKPLMWTRPSTGQCLCGADLTTQGVKKTCSVALGNLLLSVRAATYRDSTIQVVPSEMAHLAELDLYTLSRFVFVLVDLIEALEGPKRNRSHRNEVEEHIERVASMLSEWPKNFQQFLAKHYDSVLMDDAVTKSFKDIFGWAFVRLGKNLRGRGKDFGFLTNEIYRFGARYWSRDRLSRGVDVASMHFVHGRWASVLEAAAAMDVDPRTLARRIDAGEIPVRRVGNEKGNRNVMVNLHWARNWKLSALAAVPPREAAKRIGVGIHMLIRLREYGAYSTTFQTRYRGGYSCEDVETFRQELKEIAAEYFPNSTPGKISIDSVPKSNTDAVAMRARIITCWIEAKRNALTNASAAPDTRTASIPSLMGGRS